MQTKSSLLLRTLLITAIYILMGTAWIYGSDAIILGLTNDPQQLSELQSAKGILFVLTTALMLGLMLYLLLGRSERLKHESEQARESLEREIDSYTRTITHDLKAPIRAVIGFSSALEEDYVKHLDPKAIDYLNRIKAAGEHLNHLIEDLLAFSRLNRKMVALRPIPLRPILNHMAPDAHLSGDPIVIGDDELIRLVLTEILGNASIFTQKGTEPDVSVKVDTSWRTVTVTIHDHGIGIESEHQTSVFEMFKRLHSRQDYPGNGVGLTMAETAMRKMKGDIQLESTYGEGTTVSLVFRKGTAS